MLVDSASRCAKTGTATKATTQKHLKYMAIKNVVLKDLIATVKMQARDKIDPDTLADYKAHAKQCKEKGTDPSFPPLVGFANPLEPDKVYLSSGFTRRQALMSTGFESYAVDVRDSEDPKRDALKFGFTANREHGARLTNADKRHNLLLALEDPEWAELSGNALAEMLGVSEAFVRANTPAAKKKTKVKNKKGGTTDTANIGKKTGSKRKKEAAAKKGAKKGAATDAGGGKGGAGAGDDGGAADSKKDTERSGYITKIANAINGYAGYTAEGFSDAVKDGSLPLSVPDLKKMAGTSDDRIRLLAPLVIGQRWSVGAAIGFIDKAPSGKTTAEHFCNLAIAHDGILRERVDDFVCIWVQEDRATIGEDKKGKITIEPKKA